MKNKISVLLATYNGENYIIEQLQSIFDQVRCPDELIIKDDCSSDRTVELCNDFILSHKLSNKWKVIVNSNNMGWKANFVDGLNYVDGDYIFFCDQDDIWKQNKILEMTACLEKYNSIGVLASNYSILNEQSTKAYIKTYKSNNKCEKYIPTAKFLYVYRPGCTYCFRKKYKKLFDLYWEKDIPHDAFLWHAGIINDELYILNKELISYRRHSGTQTGMKISNREQRLNDLDYYKKICSLYIKMDCSEQLLNYVKNASKWIKNREYGLTGKRKVQILNNLKYIGYYWSVKTFLMDIKYTFIKDNNNA